MKPLHFYLAALVAGFCLLLSTASPSDASQPAAAPAGPNTTYSTWECWDDGTLDPCHSSLNSISMVSTSDGWAVGSNGLVLRWNGIRWNSILVPAIGTKSLGGVFMRTAEDGWITSFQIGLWRWNGSEWSSISLPPGVYGLSSILPLAVDNAWALSYVGDIFHWDGSSWSLFQAVGGLKDIAVVSASDGWAVGDGGKMLRFDGSAWNTYAGPVTYDLYSIAMASASNGWATDQWPGNSIRWDGLTWTSSGNISDGTSIRGLVAAGSIVYRVSAMSVARWDGSAWVTCYDLWSETYWIFTGIGITPGTNGDEVWVVGSTGGIWHGQNGAWIEVNNQKNWSYTALAFTSPSSGWAFGYRITGTSKVPINHWNGNTWALTGETNGINAVEITPGTNGQDGWAVGYKNAYHWNGSTWDPVAFPPSNTLNDLDLLAPGEGWGVGGWGTNGLITRLHGGVWSVFSTPSYGLYGVSMVSANDGWAVGENGVMLRWDGTSWNVTTSPTTNYLSAVVMLSATEGWAGGSNVLLNWDGSGSWHEVSLPQYISINSMAFASSHNGWATEWYNGGKILRYDHSGWSFIDAPVSLRTVAFTTYREVWAISEGGIVHYQGSPPALSANFTLGAPGSFFHFEGQDLPPDGMTAITVNGHVLGSVSTGDNGMAAFNLDSSGAEEGLYLVTVQAGEGTAQMQFSLQAGQPQQPKESSEITFMVPQDIAYHAQIFAPVIARQ